MSDAAEVRSDPNQSWAFAGWGEARKLDDLGSEPVQVKMLGWGHGKHLGQWLATALCGNDITSSCLYVAALSSLAAGIYAPLALILVALILYLFRSIYGEVGAALPLNGGTYTLLLNSTNKKLAAACLTLLSYIATAVIGVGEGMRYARILIPGLNVSWATIGLMFLRIPLLRVLLLTSRAIVDRVTRLKLAVKGEFGPELIERLSQHLQVPKNYMFIGTPGDHFPHRLESLGGVRLIL